ncbi:MAG: MATE family efflux transporter [Pseudomonadota bacterium]
MSRNETAVTRNRLQQTFDLLRESLKHSDRDLTKGPIRKALILLAIPMVLEMAMESVFAIVDIFWVAKLGAEAIAVVGLTEAMLSLLYAICLGFGMAVTAVVSRRIGEKNPEAAAATAGQAIWISMLLASIIGVAGYWYAEPMLKLMGADDAVISQGLGFTQVLLGGSASIFYIFVLNAVFRGAGDATIAMRSLWLANGINLVLDPCLIFGWWIFPEMGVTGAAVATTIGRSAGVAYQLYHLFWRPGRIQMTRRSLRFDGKIALRLGRLSLGGIGQFLIATSSWLFMIRIVAVFGSTAIAGFTIAIRALEFVILPAWGLGNAAATLVGQNLGAGLPERASRSAWRASYYNFVAMLIIAILFGLFAETIVGWFSTEAGVFESGVLCIRYLGLSLPIYATGMILTQSLNGAGVTRTPTILNLVAFWILQIPLALYLAQTLLMGPKGVLIAMIVAEALLSATAALIFYRGRWQHSFV